MARIGVDEPDEYYLYAFIKKYAMLTAIEGYYEKGKVFLNEVPNITTKTGVIVTFLSEMDIQEKSKSAKRILGKLAGKITLPGDFNEPMEVF